MKDENVIIEKLSFNLKGNVADILAEKIKNMIIYGDIEPGYIFPSENVFCKQLNVSRSTLREAYKTLESTGFIRRRKGQGTIVNDYSSISQSAPFSTYIQLADITELIYFRELIESELAKLAALNATPENIQKMESALDNMKINASNISKLTYYDTNFHIEVANASHNKLMISIMNSIEPMFSNSMYNAFHVDTNNNIQQAIDYHTNILEAIKNHDAALAQDLMRQHIRIVEHHFKLMRMMRPSNIY